MGDSRLSLQNLSNPLSSALPTSVRVKGKSVDGFTNAGFWGIDVRPQTYTGSFYAKGSYTGSFTASLVSSSGETLASVYIPSMSIADKWVQLEFTLAPTTTASDTSKTFSLTFDASVSLEHKLVIHWKY